MIKYYDKIIIIFYIILLIYYYSKFKIENFNNVITILEPSNRRFPFKYFKDENSKTLPIVALTAFFRSNDDKQLYNKFIKSNIPVIGVTAYKTFPLIIRDQSEDKYHLSDDFNYLKNIKVWLACMANLSEYGFTEYNNSTIDISESDFFDAEINVNFSKKYDFIYICNKDADNCPMTGWNAINRNYNLALKCFPIMVHEYKLKGLCVGRIGCDLSEYKDYIETTDFLPYHELQQRMRESRFLFLPNIYDASPRVVAECLIKNVPVLMNKSIICGFKYINNNTGAFFIDEHNIRNGLDIIIYKLSNNLYSTNKWWSNNYGYKNSSKKLRNFLYNFYPDEIGNSSLVSFIP